MLRLYPVTKLALGIILSAAGGLLIWSSIEFSKREILTQVGCSNYRGCYYSNGKSYFFQTSEEYVYCNFYCEPFTIIVNGESFTYNGIVYPLPPGEVMKHNYTNTKKSFSLVKPYIILTVWFGEHYPVALEGNRKVDDNAHLAMIIVSSLFIGSVIIILVVLKIIYR